jgi:hypothetical protein
LEERNQWLADHPGDDSDDDEQQEEKEEEEEEEEEEDDEPNIHGGHTADEEALGALFSGLGGLANPNVARIAHHFGNGTPPSSEFDSEDDSD